MIKFVYREFIVRGDYGQDRITIKQDDFGMVDSGLKSDSGVIEHLFARPIIDGFICKFLNEID